MNHHRITLLELFSVMTVFSVGVGMISFALRQPPFVEVAQFFAAWTGFLCISSAVIVPGRRLVFGSASDGEYSIRIAIVLLVLLAGGFALGCCFGISV